MELDLAHDLVEGEHPDGLPLRVLGAQGDDLVVGALDPSARCWSAGVQPLVAHAVHDRVHRRVHDGASPGASMKRNPPRPTVMSTKISSITCSRMSMSTTPLAVRRAGVHDRLDDGDDVVGAVLAAAAQVPADGPRQQLRPCPGCPPPRGTSSPRSRGSRVMGWISLLRGRLSALTTRIPAISGCASQIERRSCRAAGLRPVGERLRRALEGHERLHVGVGVDDGDDALRLPHVELDVARDLPDELPRVAGGLVFEGARRQVGTENAEGEQRQQDHCDEREQEFGPYASESQEARPPTGGSSYGVVTVFSRPGGGALLPARAASATPGACGSAEPPGPGSPPRSLRGSTPRPRARPGRSPSGTGRE